MWLISLIPRPVRRLLLFLIIFIFVNICMFLTSPSSPGQVRSRFARRREMERDGGEDSEIVETSFESSTQLEESSSVN